MNDYSAANGFAAGFQNFHQADYGEGIVLGCILIRGGVEWRDVPAAELGNPAGMAPRFRTVHDYTYNKGFVGGIPNFHEANYGQGIVYGCLPLKGDIAEWRDIPVSDFCALNARLNDASFRYQSAHISLRPGQRRNVLVAMQNTAPPPGRRAATTGSAQAPQDNSVWDAVGSISRLRCPRFFGDLLVRHHGTRDPRHLSLPVRGWRSRTSTGSGISRRR